MDRNQYQDRQHISTDRLNQDQTDVEVFIAQYFKDLVDSIMPTADGKAVWTGLDAIPTAPQSYAVIFNPGAGLADGTRVVIGAAEPELNRTLTWIDNSLTQGPTPVLNTTMWRKDLIWLKFSRLDADSVIVRFILPTGGVENRTIYQRKTDYFEMGVEVGVQAASDLDCIIPTAPSGALPIAVIVNSPGATAIYSATATPGTTQAYIHDVRKIITLV